MLCFYDQNFGDKSIADWGCFRLHFQAGVAKYDWMRTVGFGANISKTDLIN